MKLAIMGYGVVGSGVAQVLDRNRASIEKKAGCPLELQAILDRREFPGDPHEKLVIQDVQRILEDPEIQIVVEAMGGTHPAYDYVKACLERGKSVVTSNKELVAAKGVELLRLAKEKNVNFLFEASVGGGIPIIHPLHQCLGANEILEIVGILNGTTNFILTKMIREQMSFEDALAMAQQLGYAEQDPTADVEGLDACRKICILASLAFGHHVYPDAVPTQGISRITREDVALAERWGGVIKLLGRVKKLENGTLYLVVGPHLVPKSHPLATVDDVFNAILVRGDATGEVVFYGKGAGKLPTASAVISDVIDAAKAEGTIPTLQWQEALPGQVADGRQVPGAFYVRLTGCDGQERACCEAQFEGACFLQRSDSLQGEVAFVAEGLSEEELDHRLATVLAQGGTLASKMYVLDGDF